MFLKKPSSHVIQTEEKKQPAATQSKPAMATQASKAGAASKKPGMQKLGPSVQDKAKVQEVQSDPWLQFGDKANQGLHPYMQNLSMGTLQQDNPANRSGYLDIALSLANALKQR